jgi:hypothetical protein
MNNLTMYEAILLWDKVLCYEERDELVRNNWSIRDTARTDAELVNEICDMTAEHMSERDLDRLHQSMVLSPRTMFFKKKLDKIETKIKSQWNKLRLMYNKKSRSPRDGDLLLSLDILPRTWCLKNAGLEWDKLSYTVKNVLRTSYNPTTNKFERLERFGKFTTRAG